MPPHADAPASVRQKWADKMTQGLAGKAAHFVAMNVTTPAIATGLLAAWDIFAEGKTPNLAFVGDKALFFSISAVTALAADYVAAPAVDVVEARMMPGWGYRERSEPGGFDDSPAERAASRLIEPIVAPVGYAIAKTFASEAYSAAGVRSEMMESGLKGAGALGLGGLVKETIWGRP